VAIDGGGGGVHPQAGRVGEAGDDLAEETGGEDAGVVDFGTVALVVAAVDTAAGEVDDDVGAFEGFSPAAFGEAVPVNGLPRRGEGTAGEHSYVVACGLEVTGEGVADLAAAAGEDDAESLGH
jgi:hypothetical protein